MAHTHRYLAQRKKPFIKRAMDKWAYVYGVAVLVLTEFFLLRHPERFWMWYATLMCFMLAARLPCVTLAPPRARLAPTHAASSCPS